MNKLPKTWNNDVGDSIYIGENNDELSLIIIQKNSMNVIIISEKNYTKHLPNNHNFRNIFTISKINGDFHLNRIDISMGYFIKLSDFIDMISEKNQFPLILHVMDEWIAECVTE